jgi:lysophospholipase L1-like esterase
MSHMISMRSLLLGFALLITHLGRAGTPASFTVAGDWDVRVTVTEPRATEAVLRVSPPPVLTVSDERHGKLPVFNPRAGGWVRGAQLRGVQAQETTTPGLLVAETLVLRAGRGADATVFERGKDYQVDEQWGTFGRTTNSAIKADQEVFASYRHAQLRLDAVVLTRDGKVTLSPGVPRAAAPWPPVVAEGERHLGNIWLPGLIAKLAPEHLFPILETAYPEPAKVNPSTAERVLPQTMKKLQSGEKLRVMAWGDSVTECQYIPEWEKNRWQAQFVTQLRERFPKANIELVTEAWGGRNTGSYLNEPPGSLHNYREKVLGAKPDLIVSEFVNDAGLNPKQVEERYAKLLADFQGIGAEWIILTPHYVRPDWMGLTREREVDEDPRPYVAGLRQFANKHPVALADASRRYGRLWRQGLPYNSLMVNSINHPDARGMKIFADALMELFP